MDDLFYQPINKPKYRIFPYIYSVVILNEDQTLIHHENDQ